MTTDQVCDRFNRCTGEQKPVITITGGLYAVVRIDSKSWHFLSIEGTQTVAMFLDDDYITVEEESLLGGIEDPTYEVLWDAFGPWPPNIWWSTLADPD